MCQGKNADNTMKNHRFFRHTSWHTSKWQVCQVCQGKRKPARGRFLLDHYMDSIFKIYGIFAYSVAVPQRW